MNMRDAIKEIKLNWHLLMRAARDSERFCVKGRTGSENFLPSEAYQTSLWESIENGEWRRFDSRPHHGIEESGIQLIEEDGRSYDILLDGNIRIQVKEVHLPLGSPIKLRNKRRVSAVLDSLTKRFDLLLVVQQPINCGRVKQPRRLLLYEWEKIADLITGHENDREEKVKADICDTLEGKEREFLSRSCWKQVDPEPSDVTKYTKTQIRESKRRWLLTMIHAGRWNDTLSPKLQLQ